MTSFYERSAQLYEEHENAGDSVIALLSPDHRRFSQISAISSLVYVNLLRCHIISLEDAYCLKSCRFLYLDDNKIEHLSTFLNGLTQLEVLSLQLNPVKEIEELRLENLQYLNLNYTSLLNLPDLSLRLPNLMSLTLQGCKLASIKPQQESKLLHIDLSDTKWSDFYFINENFPELQNIDLNFYDDCIQKFQYVKSNITFKNVTQVNEDEIQVAKDPQSQPSSQNAQVRVLIYLIDQMKHILNQNLLNPIFKQLTSFVNKLILSQYLIQNDIANIDQIYSQEATYQSEKENEMIQNLHQNLQVCQQLKQQIDTFNNQMFNQIDDICYLLNYNQLMQLYDLNNNLFIEQTTLEMLFTEIINANNKNPKYKIFAELASKFSLQDLQSTNINVQININMAAYKQYKQKLLEEIEVSEPGCVIEYRQEKFDKYYNDKTEIKYIYLTEEDIIEVKQRINNIFQTGKKDGSYNMQDTLQIGNQYSICICTLQFKYKDNSTSLCPLFNIINTDVQYYYNCCQRTISEFTQQISQIYKDITETYNGISRSQANVNTDVEKLIKQQESNQKIYICSVANMEIFQLSNNNVEELCLVNNNNLSKIVLQNLPNLTKLDLSFNNQLDLISTIQSLPQDIKKQIKQFNFYLVNNSNQLLDCGFVINQLKSLEYFNGKYVDRYKLQYQNDILKLQTNYQQFENTESQYPKKQIMIQQNMSLSGQHSISINKQIAEFKNYETFIIANCTYFQYQNLKSINIVNLNISNIKCNIDLFLQNSINLHQIQYLNISNNYTENTFNFQQLLNVKYFLLDYVYNMNYEYCNQQLCQLPRNYLCAYSQLCNEPVANGIYYQALNILIGTQKQSLQYISIYNNKIFELFMYFPYLRYYNGMIVSQQLIQRTLSQFTANINLTIVEQRGTIFQENDQLELNLSSSNIQQIVIGDKGDTQEKFEHFWSQITSLNLADNQISQIYLPESHKHIRRLNLSNNKIVEPFYNNMAAPGTELEELIIKNNPITSLKPLTKAATTLQYNLFNLTYLDISGTKQCKSLQSQTFSQFGNLQTLIMNDCYFINISGEALLGLHKLQRLELCSCRLRDCTILEGIRQYWQLRTLLLSDNAISTVTPVINAIRYLKLKTLDLRGNRFCKTGGYRQQILESMYESLADFDGQKVSQEERDAIIEALRLREEEAAEQNRIQVLQIGRGPKRF